MPKPGWYVAKGKETKQNPIVYLGIRRCDFELPSELDDSVNYEEADYVNWRMCGYIPVENFLKYFTLTHRIVNSNPPALVAVDGD